MISQTFKKSFNFPMVYVVRHSQRCDKVPDLAERSKIEYKYDVPITNYGHEIAYKTGQFLKYEMERLKLEKLRHENFKYCILSSPYYRCLQTSLQICKGIFNNLKISDRI